MDFKKIPGVVYNKPQYVIKSAFKFRLNLSVCSQFQRAEVRRKGRHRDGGGETIDTPPGMIEELFKYIYIGLCPKFDKNWVTITQRGINIILTSVV